MEYTVTGNAIRAFDTWRYRYVLFCHEVHITYLLFVKFIF